MAVNSPEGYLVGERLEVAYSQLNAQTPEIRQRAKAEFDELTDWLDCMEAQFGDYARDGLCESMGKLIKRRIVKE